MYLSKQGVVREYYELKTCKILNKSNKKEYRNEPMPLLHLEKISKIPHFKRRITSISKASYMISIGAKLQIFILQFWDFLSQDF